ncbi:MAG: RNA 2',3'-cyclic phosphodiesterase [Bacilli bacterium]|nr:RNA 2',3'-cyclic phosphodiesterase [Bacilli bacterium]MBN2877474.1 RNA 2',3'-cyclic phosphodiesterase [Bacilli bacterium]
MRLFIALLFPYEIKDTIYDVLEEVEEISEDGNFTDYDNLHLTVLYLGETSKEMYQRIKEKCSEIIIKPFSYETSHIGMFQKNKPKKIVYLGVKNNYTLQSLYNQVVIKLRELGLSIPTSKYTPHITLGRQVSLIADQDLERIQVKPLTIQADRISLMESTRVEGILTYIERDHIRLQ